jgi:RHS repeat-associated protein
MPAAPMGAYRPASRESSEVANSGGSHAGRARTGCLLIGVSLLLMLWGAPARASAAECTDTWVGPESGKWVEAESWSAEHVPTETDVACIPESHRVTVDSGAQRVEILQGSGELVLTEASLAVVGVTEPSNIGTLRLKEGGELGGAAEISVVDQLVALGGLMKGDGSTKVGVEATGEVVGGEFGGQPGLRVTQKRELSVHGSMDIGGEDGELRVVEAALMTVFGSFEVHGSTGKLALRESADLVNSGTFSVEGPEGRVAASESSTVVNNEVLTVAGKEGGLNATESAEVLNAGKLTVAGAEGEVRIDSTKLENSGEVTIAGPAGRMVVLEGGQIDNEGTLKVNSEAAGSGLLAAATVFPSHLENTGTLVKTQGTETSLIEVPIDNEALVESQTGILLFTGGGSSGQEGHSEWVAQSENTYAAQTKLVFALDSFSFGEEATLGGEIQILDGGGITADGIAGEENSIWLYGGSLHLLNGHPKVLERLGVAAGTATLDGGSELAAENLEVTDAYLETSGAGELEEPAEVVFGAEAKVQAGFFYQSLGSVQMGSKASFDGVFVNEGGAFAAGDEAVFTGESFYAEDSFLAGASTQFLFGNAVNSGTFELGGGSTVSGDHFWQEIGSADFGSGTTIGDGLFWVHSGTASFGENSTLDLSEMFWQEQGATTFEPGVSVNAVEVAFFEDGTVNFDSGARLEAGKAHVQSASVELDSGVEVVTDELFLEGGKVSGPGTITTGKLGWWSTVLEGDGTAEVLESGFLGHSTTCGNPCVDNPKYATLRERELILRGGFTMGISTLGMADGAKMINYGTFDASSEKAEWGSEIQIAPESNSNPKIVNHATFEKQTGSGTTYVDVPFKNLGRVGRREGTLSILRPLNVPESERFGKRCHCGDPVETSTGNFSESQTDLSVGGLGAGLTLTRSYSAQAAAAAASPGPFGYGWTYSFGDRLLFEEEGAQITIQRADGSTVPFASDGKGSYQPPEWSQDTLSGSAESGYTYTSANQVERHFTATGALASVVDRNGNETTLAYDEAGRLKALTDPAGRQLTFAYTPGGQVESATDPMGHVVKYAYEGGNLASVTMPGEASPRWQFKYDASHRITQLTDGRGGKTSNEYDSSSRVVSQTDPAGRTLTLEYDGFHTRTTNKATGAVTDTWFNSNNEPTSVTHGYGTPAATTETFSYDEAGHELTRADGKGHTTTYTYNGAGDRTSLTDPNKSKTEWAFDATHDLISTTTPRGETTTIKRDGNGNVESISRPAPGGATQTTSFAHDEHGQLESLTDPLERTWSFGYDAYGNRTSQTNPLGDTTTFGYDKDSRLVSIVSPRGNAEGAKASEYETTVERDAQGRPLKVTDPLGHATSYAYDANGNLASITDANSHTTKYTYNADDERTKVEKPNGATVETGYDGAGYVTSQTDGNGKTTTYVRNVLEQPVEVIDPLSRKTTETFDAAGNLASVVDPDERKTTYAYDDAGRLTGVDYSEAATPDATFEYDADGNLTAMQDGTGESTFAYDQLGRLTRSENGHGDVVEYAYDLGEEQTGILYPNGKAVSRGYDAAGRLESVTDWLGGKTSFAYDADSNLKGIAFPSGSGNVDEYAYDRASRMSGATFKKGTETLASLTYTRDALGQVEKEARSGLPGPAETTFGYDANNRLVKAGADAYEYDKADNLTKAPGTTNSYDVASQLATGTATTYAFDKEGERTSETHQLTEGPEFLRTFGGAGSGAGNLSAPGDIATDSEGNAWVLDTGHNRVQEFDSKGQFIRQFGAYGSGNGEFSSPQGIAVDAEDNVWVASGTARVQEFSHQGAFIRAWSAPAEFGNASLSGIALDAEGHVWASGSFPVYREGKFLTDHVEELTATGARLRSFGPSGAENGQLQEPQDLTVDAAGNVWVADTANHRIQEFTAAGAFVRKFGSKGSGEGQLSSPYGLATDAEGNLWVADTGNDRLQEFSSTGTYLSQLGAPGNDEGQLAEPKGLALDAGGNIWVADTGNNRVQELAASEFLRTFGGAGSGAGNLSAPGDIATDSEGNAWVLDTGHNRVQEFDSKGQFIRQFGAYGSGNGEFSSPQGIAVDAEDNVWVASGTARVQEFSHQGAFIRAWSAPAEFGNASLSGIALDAEGHVWASGSFPVYREGKFLTDHVEELTATGARLRSFGPSGAENGQLQEPQDLTVDAAGNVWVADTANHRIQEFTAAGAFVRKFGSKGSGEGQLSSPYGLATDAEGNLWVADTGNDRLQEFSSTGTYLSQLGAPGNDEGQLAEPKGLALDAGGNIWVADTINNRVQEFQSQYTTTYTYDQAGSLTSVQRPETAAEPAINQTLAYDATGLLVSRTTGLATRHLTWDASNSLPLLLNDDENSYIYGPNGLPIEQISTAEEPTYLHHDQLGSTRLLTDATGKTSAAFSYQPYGSLEAKTGTATTPLGFAGQYTDAETGLQYLRARFYDTGTGQFLTRDPLEAITGPPYSYASDNPVNLTDPSGLSSWNPFSKSFWTEGNFISESDLNPLKYYEKEIEAWENGSSYWGAVSHGLVGACVLASDATGLGALGRGLLGRGVAALVDRVAGSFAAADYWTEQFAIRYPRLYQLLLEQAATIGTKPPGALAAAEFFRRWVEEHVK